MRPVIVLTVTPATSGRWEMIGSPVPGVWANGVGAGWQAAKTINRQADVVRRKEIR